MRDSSEYREIKPIDVDCCVSYSISKSMPVKVVDHDERLGNDLSDVNFIKEFNADPSTIGISGLLEELQKLAKLQVEKLRDEQHLTNSGKIRGIIKREIEYYEDVIKAAKDWIVDDMDVVPEE